MVNWIGPDGSSILTSPRYGMEVFKPRSIWETIASSNSEEYVKGAFAAGIRHPVGMCLQDAGWSFGPWLRGHGYVPTKYETWRGYFAGVVGGEKAIDWRFSQEDVLVGLMWGAQVLQRIARSVRHSENLLVQAEKMAAMAGVWKGMAWPSSTLDEAWRMLLLSQHHDCWIVPYNGKPGDTWADKVRRWTGGTDARADSVIRLAAGSGLGWVRVYNTTGVGRKEWVSYGGLRFIAEVPPMGYVSYRMDSLKTVHGDSPAAIPLGVGVSRGADGRVTIRSDLHTIVVDPAKGGAIVSWIFGGRELVERGKGLGELRGNFYNDGGFRSSVETPAEVVVEDGVVVVRGQIAGHPFREEVRVRAGEPRVDFHLRIDWKGNPDIGEYFEVPKDQEVRKAYYDDRYKLLVLVPVDLGSPKIFKNAPFDVTESRLDNTFYNRWDSIKNNVILDWVDLEDTARGLALFTDHTTSYAHGDSIPLGLTVQYSGNGIFYRNYTIDGPTELNYALLPHVGRWDTARVWTAATKWKEPLIVVAAGEGGSRSLLRGEPGVEVSSVRWDGNALFVRLFNAEAGSGEVRLWLGFVPRSAEEIELDGRKIKTLKVIKEDKGAWVRLGIPHFGIRTIKFEHE